MDKIKVLPNLGNTCFLNTALQVFLNNKSFIKKCINSKNKLLKLIYKLKYSEEFSKDVTIINKIMLLLGYSNTQNDSHEALLKIMEQLESEDFKLLKEYFSIGRYKDFVCIKCKEINKNKKLTVSNWMSYSDFDEFNKSEKYISCSSCEDTNKSKFIIDNYSNILIFYPSSKTINVKININNTLIYTLSMINVFIGNDNNGHYFNLYKNKTNEWIKIDDITTNKINDISTFLKGNIQIVSIIYKKEKQK